MPRLSEKARKNKVAYNVKRNRELYKQFNVRILNEDYDNLMELIEKNNMNKASFIRWAYDKLRQED